MALSSFTSLYTVLNALAYDCQLLGIIDLIKNRKKNSLAPKSISLRRH